MADDKPQRLITVDRALHAVTAFLVALASIGTQQVLEDMREFRVGVQELTETVSALVAHREGDRNDINDLEEDVNNLEREVRDLKNATGYLSPPSSLPWHPLRESPDEIDPFRAGADRAILDRRTLHVRPT